LPWQLNNLTVLYVMNIIVYPSLPVTSQVKRFDGECVCTFSRFLFGLMFTIYWHTRRCLCLYNIIAPRWWLQYMAETCTAPKLIFLQ
jgi:hypothetical protein